MTKTIWEEDINVNNKDNDIPKEVDILIIGGGIAGISTAFYLKDSNYNIAVIDLGNFGMGVTHKTTGKITYFQDNIYQKIKLYCGKDACKKYFQSQKKAIHYILKNIQQYNIDCDLQNVSSYIFSINKDLNKEEKIFKDLNVKFTNEKLPINFPCDNAIKVNNTYVFHPLKYLYKLIEICESSGISFISHTVATEIVYEKDYYICHTSKGDIKCKKIVCTTHYPFFIKPLFIPFKTHIEKSYVIVSEDKNKNFSAITSCDKTHSIRYHKDFLIYSGFNHKLGNKSNNQKNINNHIKRYKKYFKGDIIYNWNTYDIITEDGMPIVGEVKDNLYIATGFNKWGMTNGTISGKIIADLILERNNSFSKLFSPKRGVIISNFLIDNLHTGKSFIKNKIMSPFHYNLKKDGKTYYYQYKKEGQIHKVCSNCPHMGCSLLLNKADNTWDCPCHGSRFSIDGELIQGPSTTSIKKRD